MPCFGGTLYQPCFDCAFSLSLLYPCSERLTGFAFKSHHLNTTPPQLTFHHLTTTPLQLLNTYLYIYFFLFLKKRKRI